MDELLQLLGHISNTPIKPYGGSNDRSGVGLSDRLDDGLVHRPTYGSSQNSAFSNTFDSPNVPPEKSSGPSEESTALPRAWSFQGKSGGPQIELTEHGVNIEMTGVDGKPSFVKLNLGDHDKPSSSSRATEVRANVSGGGLDAKIEGHTEKTAAGRSTSINLSINQQTKATNDVSYDIQMYRKRDKRTYDYGNVNELDNFESMTKFLLDVAPPKMSEDDFDLDIEPEKDDDKRNTVVYRDDKIEGKYYYDLDILAIDRIICRSFEKKLCNIEKERRKLRELRKCCIRCPHDRNVLKQYQKLSSDIKNIESGKELSEYQTKVRPILENYIRTRDLTKTEFGQKRDIVYDPDHIGVISGYLEVAHNYIKINLIHVRSTEYNCDVCQYNLKDISPDINGFLVCPGCQTETIPLHQEVHQTDKASGKTYDSIKTFVKSMECYVGGQQVTFSPTLFHELDLYFEANKFLTDGLFLNARRIRTLPLKGDFVGRRRRGNTSRSLMVNALKATGNFKHYKDSFLLCRIYWGWESPDLSGVRDRLLREHQIIQPIFNSVKGDRKSSLGAGYQLFRQLWHIGFPCHPSEFGIVQTNQILQFYESVWEKIVKIAGPKLGWRKFQSIESLFHMDPYTLELPKTF